MIDNRLYEYMAALMKRVPMTLIRYMYERINWNGRLVGIIGPRGVGKSTMVMQRIKLCSGGHHLYVSVDNMYFNNHPLQDFIDDFVKEGGTHLYIDEIHKCPGWSTVLKQAYDIYPDLHIVFTGSSVLDIRKGEADLSRRALIYSMQGLSFREYLSLFHGVNSRSYTFDEILDGKVEIPNVEHPLPLFREYLSRGYYPFAIEGDFDIRMNQVVAQTIDVDICQYADMKASTSRKLKSMLAILSSFAPYKPSMENLATEIGVSKNSVPDYLVYLERAGMIGLLRDNTAGMRALGKIEKVYIDNTSLMAALNVDVNIGTMRETFFYNQMRVNHDVFASKVSDFFIDGFTFEIGGKKKGRKQIEDVENGRIVKDDIEVGHGIVIPLWTFGMNY